jgi:hypothetical protein
MKGDERSGTAHAPRDHGDIIKRGKVSKHMRAEQQRKREGKQKKGTP